MRTPPILATLLLLSACGRDAPPPADTPASAATAPAPEPAPAPTPTPVVPSPVTRAPTFVGAPWHAIAGSGVEAGTRYTFQPDGVLLVEAPSGTPAQGAWRYENDALTMTEEGIDYPTDIVSQDATHLVLRSHNPGGTMDLVLEREAAGTPVQ
jgi:hypothetical protein